MTELLKKAFEKASQLSPSEQDALASVLLEEIEGEHRWDASLENSRDPLATLADAALKEHRSGATKPLNSDTL